MLARWNGPLAAEPCSLTMCSTTVMRSEHILSRPGSGVEARQTRMDYAFKFIMSGQSTMLFKLQSPISSNVLCLGSNVAVLILNTLKLGSTYSQCRYRLGGASGALPSP
jgi:hypothetical protein